MCWIKENYIKIFMLKMENWRSREKYEGVDWNLLFKRIGSRFLRFKREEKDWVLNLEFWIAWSVYFLVQIICNGDSKNNP